MSISFSLVPNPNPSSSSSIGFSSSLSLNASSFRPLLHPTLSISIVHLPSTIRMGGGPRTYPGGVSKWQWKRMQAKKAKQLLKARLCRERQLYEMRKRAELQAAVSELERPWEVVDRARTVFSVSADEQVKVLADRFQRPGGYDLWSENDGPQLFRSPADGLPTARFFPKGVVHSIKPYGRVAGVSEDRKDLPPFLGSVAEARNKDPIERRMNSRRGRRLNGDSPMMGNGPFSHSMDNVKEGQGLGALDLESSEDISLNDLMESGRRRSSRLDYRRRNESNGSSVIRRNNPSFSSMDNVKRGKELVPLNSESGQKGWRNTRSGRVIVGSNSKRENVERGKELVSWNSESGQRGWRNTRSGRVVVGSNSKRENVERGKELVPLNSESGQRGWHNTRSGRVVVGSNSKRENVERGKELVPLNSESGQRGWHNTRSGRVAVGSNSKREDSLSSSGSRYRSNGNQQGHGPKYLHQSGSERRAHTLVRGTYNGGNRLSPRKIKNISLSDSEQASVESRRSPFMSGSRFNNRNRQFNPGSPEKFYGSDSDLSHNSQEIRF